MVKVIVITSQWRRHYRLCFGHCVHRVMSIFNYVSILLCFSSFWFWHTLCTIYQHIVNHICAVNLNDLVKKNCTKLLIAFILKRLESLFFFLFCFLPLAKPQGCHKWKLVDSNVTLIFYFEFQGFLCVIVWLNQSPESCTFTPLFTVSSHWSLLGTTVWLWTEDSRFSFFFFFTDSHSWGVWFSSFFQRLWCRLFWVRGGARLQSYI